MKDISIHAHALELHKALMAYIEATYHISDKDLLRQRAELLSEPEVVHQLPFLESTPRYQAKDKFSAIAGLHPAAREALETLVPKNHLGKHVLFDPPYLHQAQAIDQTVVQGKNLVIMTGTGSGKTESFLMPILSKLAIEAKERPETWSSYPAVRAMILYPMNALVNDQLSRLRGMFGDPRIRALFESWADRPPRFARYTSRSPYAGLRTVQKDGKNLKQIGDFYVKTWQAAEQGDQAAQELLSNLRGRGKWPAKPDLESWYGKPGSRWKDKSGEFKRAVTLPGDSELLTRHEVQANPPDLLVTNYSMLEYMLMRPVERGIFDRTCEWLKLSKNNRFTLVLDEAHLYRGAPGTEVAFLVRRLRDRLQIENDQFQVIGSTASFSSAESARNFVADLTDTSPGDMGVAEGTYAFRSPQGPGTIQDAEILARIDVGRFNDAEEAQRLPIVREFLDFRAVKEDGSLGPLLHRALDEYEPLNFLINETMKVALPTSTLPELIFPDVPYQMAGRAALALTALASCARSDEESASLLPARVHTFFRGLPGLWVCMDPNCTGLPEPGVGVAGRLYSQPRERCESCNAVVLQLYTCRYCGTAYAVGFSPTPESPRAVWQDPGARLAFESEVFEPLLQVDLQLSEPTDGGGEACFDLVTGEIDSKNPTPRTRPVYLAPVPNSKKKGGRKNSDSTVAPGRFVECGCCRRRSRRVISPVQDHETKGDEPLRLLVSKQLQLQPVGKQKWTPLAPLRGKKVLIFSDSRQVAARLAPQLQTYSTRDAIRAALAIGWNQLRETAKTTYHLGHLYTAALLGAQMLGVRLRPELATNESFQVYEDIGAMVAAGEHKTSDGLAKILAIGSDAEANRALLVDVIDAVRDPLVGFQTLALASIVERADRYEFVTRLPSLVGVAETPQQKLELFRAWLNDWRDAGFFTNNMPGEWTQQGEDVEVRVKLRGEAFEDFTRRLPDSVRKRFKSDWLKPLLQCFAEPMGAGKYRLKGSQLALDFGGSWVTCLVCRTPQRPCHAIQTCAECGEAALESFDPENDAYFRSRKGFYRDPIAQALRGEGYTPIALIAAEHTAQLNAAQHEDVFSKGERNELLFQDVPLAGPAGALLPAIDVLSSTTTMEVGIDIGQLSGVALRNMPPSRASYQQRAGRAGRRANAVASVLAYSGLDTHDEHFFTNPAEMIRGPVVDPRLSLNNKEIAERHLNAFLLQSYLQSKTGLVPTDKDAQLFSTLGTVAEFKLPSSKLNRKELGDFLSAEAEALKCRAEKILPGEIVGENRIKLLDSMAEKLLAALDSAIADAESTSAATTWTSEEGDIVEVEEEAGEERPVRAPAGSKFLLDRLLYKGILPRYAFPTDVATFHIFNSRESTKFRPRFEYLPSQGMVAALSQYAPGKDIWVDNRLYRSGAIYAPVRNDLYQAWEERMLHAECSRCGYSDRWRPGGTVDLRAVLDCPACEGVQSLGPVHHWFRPTGFAHPHIEPAKLRPDELAPPTYATRAKLTLKTSDTTSWSASIPGNPRIRVYPTRETLLVSNTGSARAGFDYCTMCGLVEAHGSPNSKLRGPHIKPFPDEREHNCHGNRVATHVILGTDFFSDVALFSFRLDKNVRLPPAATITSIAMRTLAEAIARAATESVLQIEHGEVVAEYRPAVTPAGVRGEESELFLYDTLPGGAGYSIRAVEDVERLFVEARRLMSKCKENCDSSCYRCLRTFRNRQDHGLIDRHVGTALIDFLLTGELPEFPDGRLRAARDLMLEDLARHEDGWRFKRHAVLVNKIVMSQNGVEREIAISNPLETPGGYEVRSPSVLVISELMARRNLARATEIARAWAGC